MLRIVVSLVLLIGITGCHKNWSGVVVEKRVYMDGYYVHVPWKRNAPVNAYPKPQPFPVNHTRSAKVDSAANVAVRSNNTPPHDRISSGDHIPNVSQPSSGAGSSPDNSQDNIAGAPNNSAIQKNDPDPTPDSTSAQNITSQDTTHFPIAAGLILPGTDTSAIADVSPQHDKRFEFPDGTFALTAELGFFNSLRNDDIRTTAGSFSLGAGLRYTMPVTSRHSVNASGSLLANVFRISQKQEKQLPLFAEHYNRERISLIKTRILLSDQIAVTSDEESPLQSFSVGVYGETQLFSTHVAQYSTRKDANAQYTFSKKREIGMRSLRHFQFGTSLRISGKQWSAFANYRISKLVQGPKGSSNEATRGDLPSLIIGIEYQMSE